MKAKIISEIDSTKFEKAINDFISNEQIVIISVTHSSTLNSEGEMCFTAIIIYKNIIVYQD